MPDLSDGGMYMRFGVFTAAAVGLAVLATPALADGDAKKGAKVFRKCKACHVADEEKNKVGPHLVGIIDRPVATVDGFKYSAAMVEFGADGKVWDIETLTVYLKKPKDLVKKTSMAFAGIKKDSDMENLIAYLQDPSAAK
ncbi:c-type cytochrome [Hoeflea prorocentri]|uniref:Cytochrome c family protein n=1 Tax=Hoeflea prorocentri TaxID=1922333 RepID=A0A9X3UEZ7_9HYPH|nr:cytochrome c family protein [Hoeflea prorocentri]MCY6379507.1 cytochrome c family protein [Hoeflea prorocentri]MDA5397307.1 cytochrome c family protein [Hoeflea prorocentri]